MDKWAAARSVKGLFPAAVVSVATTAPPPHLPARKSPPTAEVLEVADAEPAHAMAGRPARTDGLLERAAGFWRRSSTPAKIGIVGGGAAGVLLFVTVLVVVSVALFGRSGGDAKVNRSWDEAGVGPAGNDNSTPPKDANSDGTSLTVEALAEEFHRNRSAAGKKYQGKTLILTGAATGLTGPEGGMYLKSGFKFQEIQVFAQFKSAESRFILAGIDPRTRTGFPMKFRCVCSGASGDVVHLSDCKLISPTPPANSK